VLIETVQEWVASGSDIINIEESMSKLQFRTMECLLYGHYSNEVIDFYDSDGNLKKGDFSDVT